MEIPKVCMHCQKQFIAKTTVTKFCSHKCASANYKKREREKRIKKVESVPLQSFMLKLQDIKEKPFLSIKEASTLLGMSRMTLYRQIKNGSLEAAKIGSRVIVKRSSIDKLFGYESNA